MMIRGGTDRSHLEQSQERMASMVRAPPPMVRSVRWVPAYDVVSGDTYLRQEIFRHQPRCNVSPLRDIHWSMVTGLHLYSAFLTSGHSKCFTSLPDLHPFMNTFTHRPRCQPCEATASSSGAVRVRRLDQGHPRTGQPALPPEQRVARKTGSLCCYEPYMQYHMELRKRIKITI